ncbi:MAG: YeeE/YedE family protein [candidate division KSB1 bacterium]|nr:YeeE/YedE family protein [candidate division KSB1 bacterium]
MNAPFYKYGLFNDEVSLIVAVLIGIGFGFFLERAGFGSARKLAAQFYFTDMTVLKVMFTAVVTAMIGLYYLSVFGVVDLSLVYLTPTFLLPQVVGGLLLGFGFVIGGYCPGTSCVAAATGKYDGWVYLLGMFLGILVFGELFPLVEKFYYMTPMRTVTLPQVLGLPYGLIVFLVSVMAVGAFAAAEWGERKMAAKKAEEKS